MAKKTTGTLWWLTEIRECEALSDATDVLLMITLADHINSEDETYVGIETLARGARCSYPTAKRHLKELQERGFILRERRRRDDGNLSTYTTKLVREALEVGITTIHDPEITMIHDQGSPRRSLTRDHPDDPAEVPSDEVPSVEENNSASTKLALSAQNKILAEFDEWWDMVPRKKAKGGALKAYRSARKKVSAETIFDGTRLWVAESQGKDLEYVPHPATWLNQERWADEATPQKALDRSTGASPLDGLLELKRQRGEFS